MGSKSRHVFCCIFGLLLYKQHQREVAGLPTSVVVLSVGKQRKP